LERMEAMTPLGEFLFPAPAQRSLPAVVRWWERRRLPYNLIVGGAGLTTLTVRNVVGSLPPNPRDVFVPVVPVLVFGLLANVCYLLGPTVELAINAIWGRKVLPVGPALYRMGLTFSTGLALLPIIVVLIDWVLRIVRAVIGDGFP
jgi:hypothetical protein